MLTAQVLPVPEHAPPQPANPELAAAVAVSVTVVPLPKLPEQVAPQAIPAGDEVRVPSAVPFTSRDTISVYAAGVPTNARSSRFRPVTLPPLRVSLTVLALPRNCASASATDSVGCASLSTAHAPATCGVAIEVPL